MDEQKYNELREAVLRDDEHSKEAFDEIKKDSEMYARIMRDKEAFDVVMGDEAVKDKSRMIPPAGMIYDMMQSEWKEITENAKKVPATLAASFNHVQYAKMLEVIAASMRDIEPYILKVLERPEYKNLKPSQIYLETYKDEKGNDRSVFSDLLADAILLKEEERRKEVAPPKIRKFIKGKDQPNAITTKGAINVLWNRTKRELLAWNNQYRYLGITYNAGIDYNTGNKGGDDDTYITLAFNFDNVANNPDFTGFNYRQKAVHDTFFNLQIRGYKRCSLADIFSNSPLSNGREPRPEDLKFCYTTLLLLREIFIYYDNSHDYPSYQKKLGEYVISARRVIDFDIDYVFAGRELKDIIIVFKGDLPPIMQAAYLKKLTYSVPIRVLQTPLKKDNKILQLQDYMLETIEFCKIGRRSNTIQIDTLLSFLDSKGDRKYKARLLSPGMGKKKPGYLIQLLDYWQSIDYLKGYEISDDLKKVTLNV